MAIPRMKGIGRIVMRHLVFFLLVATAVTLGIAALYFLSPVQAQNGGRLVRVSSNVDTSAGITLLPTSANFSVEPLGLMSPGQKFTVTNNSAAALTIRGVKVTTGFSRFNTCPSTLDVGASCVITVNFVPSAGGPITGTLSILDLDPSSPQIA